MLSVDQVEQLVNIWKLPPTPPGSLLPGVWHWGRIGNFPIDLDARTMVWTWLTMILVAVFAIGATRNVKVEKPGKLQNMLEMIWDLIGNMAYENMSSEIAASLMSVVVTFFLFILFANTLDVVPTITAPTADYQTTFALALITFVLIYVYGFRYTRGRFLRHFLTPFMPLTIVEEVAKPITLAFRLFGNIYAGDLLILVLLGLLGGWVHVFGGFIASVVWLAFSIFVGAIQAFIFTVLSIAYIGSAVGDHH
ncbi:MAG: F0F1 ATP synthase subunit A [Peptococcaceae bacterium]|jgi:F-type H+-transporting ATPase subunit a|nr:F0F1 ATP synthase subunit A [Peptococcaceae bacterium]